MQNTGGSSPGGVSPADATKKFGRVTLVPTAGVGGGSRGTKIAKTGATNNGGGRKGAKGGKK